MGGQSSDLIVAGFYHPSTLFLHTASGGCRVRKGRMRMEALQRSRVVEGSKPKVLAVDDERDIVEYVTPYSDRALRAAGLLRR